MTKRAHFLCKQRQVCDVTGAQYMNKRVQLFRLLHEVYSLFE